MSQWEKLLDRICSLSRDLRFDEIQRILENYGYEMRNPRNGSSHSTFRKEGYPPITIPRHEPIKKFMLKWSKISLRVRCLRVRTIDDYMKLRYRMEVVEDPDEGGYVISFPDLKGCITCGETIEDALKNAKEAKHEWFLAALEDGYPIPEPDELESYSGQFKLRIPRSLHRQLALHSKREGISMNQYCLYLLSLNDAKVHPM